MKIDYLRESIKLINTSSIDWEEENKNKNTNYHCK